MTPTPSTKLIQAGVNRDLKNDGTRPKASALSRLSAEAVLPWDSKPKSFENAVFKALF
jgi:hypothetical protein